MRAAGLSLIVLAASASGCDGQGDPDRSDPPIYGGAGGSAEVSDGQALGIDESGSSSAASGGDVLQCEAFSSDTVQLRPRSARDFDVAARAASEVARGVWPAEPPEVAELYAMLGPRVGPTGGRFVGRFAGDRLGAWYLPAPQRPEVHVVVVIDLGPSIRQELPLIGGALTQIADTLGESGKQQDALTVVEWTDEALVPISAVAGADARPRVDAYLAELQGRQQLGGSPSLSAARDAVAGAIAGSAAPAHVMLFTDGSLSVADPGTHETLGSWRDDGAEVSIVEVQVFETGAFAAAPLPAHASLTADRKLADAGFYLAAGVMGADPSARALDPDHTGMIGWLFSTRFDDLFRPAAATASFSLTKPSTVVVTSLEAPDASSGLEVGTSRLGSGGSLFFYVGVEPGSCQGFTGKTIVEGPSGRLAQSDVDYDPAAGGSPYGTLLAALDGAAEAMASRTCATTVGGIPELSAALSALTEAQLSAAGIVSPEREAFDESRSATGALLLGIQGLCGP